MESRIDRHVESGRVPDTAATWRRSIKTMRSAFLVQPGGQVAFDVSRSGIGRGMINRDRAGTEKTVPFDRGLDPVCFRTCTRSRVLPRFLFVCESDEFLNAANIGMFSRF